jgi:hypothetical protein
MSMKEIEWLLQNRSAVAKEPWISVNDCQVQNRADNKGAAAAYEDWRRSLIRIGNRSGAGGPGGRGLKAH